MAEHEGGFPFSMKVKPMKKKPPEENRQAGTPVEGGGVSAGQELKLAATIAGDMRNVTDKALVTVPKSQALPTYAIYIVAALVFGIAITLIVKEHDNNNNNIMGGFLAALGIAAILTVFIVQKRAEATELNVEDANPVYPQELKKFCERVRANDTDLKLYSFCCPAGDVSSKPDTESDEFFHAMIYHLWADPLGGNIKATCHKKPDGSPFAYHLEIEFKSARAGYPSNVAIRPCGNFCFHRNANEDFLCLEIKTEKPAALTFRLYDQQFTQWGWGKAEQARRGYLLEFKTDWIPVAIPLERGPWFSFPADGNTRYRAEKADFSRMIPAIVIELGSSGGPAGLNAGSGRVFIRNIHLATSDPNKLKPL